MRTINRLTARTVKVINTPGLWPDGGNLFLRVSPSGTKAWVLRYVFAGRQRDMGLGPFPLVTLAEAREKATQARKLRSEGIDPLSVRMQARAAAARDAVSRMVFSKAAEQYIEIHKAGWKNAKHEQQWTNTLTTYAGPVIGTMDVADIDTAHILKILEPIWSEKAETASRLRQRIESVLDWATSREHRAGPNPARYVGHLENLLPKIKKKIKSHASLSYQKVPGFMVELRKRTGNAAQALELLIYTGVRHSEVTGAIWGEFDLEKKTWSISAARMKMAHGHDVPLTDDVIKFLKARPGERKPDDLVFPSENKTPLSDSALMNVMFRIGFKRGEITSHGFRSSLRTWIGENLDVKTEVAEAVLAHDKRGKIQQVYERTRFFEQRVPIMALWAKYINTPPAEEFQLPSPKAA
jgi:integrase